MKIKLTEIASTVDSSAEQYLNKYLIAGAIKEYEQIINFKKKDGNIANTLTHFEGVYSKNGMLKEQIVTIIRAYNVSINEKETLSEYLQLELDHTNRELSSTIILENKKNELLIDVKDRLEKIKKLSSPSNKKEINEILKNINRNLNFEEDWSKFTLHFEKVHPEFFTKIGKRFPMLTTKQLRLCAYIVIGLSTKEIAKLLHVETKSIDMAKYRLKRKMRLKGEEKINQVLQSFY